MLTSDILYRYKAYNIIDKRQSDIGEKSAKETVFYDKQSVASVVKDNLEMVKNRIKLDK